MKLLHLSKIKIDVQKIAAIEPDLLMADGRRTTVIYIPGLSVFQLYSDDPNYEEDKAKLLAAFNEEGLSPAIEGGKKKEPVPTY